VPLRALILVLSVLISLPICIVRPFYGILVWSIFSFLRPQAFVWQSNYLFPLATAVALATMIGFLVFCRGWAQRLASSEVVLLGVLWVWFTLTSVVSSNTPLFMHHAAATWEHLQFVSKVLLMTLLTIAVVDSFARLRILVIVTAGCFGAFVLKALPFMILTGGSFRLYGPENSMIADNNDFGLALNMSLPLFFFLAMAESNRWLRWLFGILFLGTIPAICFTYSRGALVGLVAVLLLMFLQLKQRLVLGPVIAIGVLIAILLAPAAWRERMDPTSRDAVDASARSRLNSWTYSWNLAKDYPVAGAGFDAFTPELFSRYAPNPEDVHGPHSIYFGVLAEHGFVGLILYLSLVCSCFISTRRVVKQAQAQGNQVLVHYANMFRFGIVGFLVCGMFLGRAYFDYFFAIVAFIAILKRVWTVEFAGGFSLEPAEEEQVA
jgi:probable O-glycosylation ligase (exosortase A-associated)